MRGQILRYDPTTAEGIISSEDGGRFAFSGRDWRGDPQRLRDGAAVDFSAEDDRAREVYLVPGSSALQDAIGSYDKSPIVAGLLALFLGGLGVHKFYLGYNTQGVILLVGLFVSWILSFVVIGLFGVMAIAVVCLIEAIIYITKSPDDFYQTYVVNKKPWF